MDEVCVGGTFDSVHAGHRLLLASTVAVTRKIVFIGITGEALLAKKRHRDLLAPFEARRDAAVGFIRAMNPHLEVAVGTLDDVTRAPMPREFFVIQNQVQHALFPLLPSPAPLSRALFFSFSKDCGKEVYDFFFYLTRSAEPPS